MSCQEQRAEGLPEEEPLSWRGAPAAHPAPSVPGGSTPGHGGVQGAGPHERWGRGLDSRKILPRVLDLPLWG